jgi:hypothetical protein
MKNGSSIDRHAASRRIDPAFLVALEKLNPANQADDRCDNSNSEQYVRNRTDPLRSWNEIIGAPEADDATSVDQLGKSSGVTFRLLDRCVA